MSEIVSTSLPLVTSDDQTEVGGCFVATYPPFSVWGKADVEADAIRQTIALAPDSVTIDLMELPYNTTISGDPIKGAGRFTGPVAN